MRFAMSLLFAAIVCFAQDSFEHVLQFSRVRQRMTETLNHLPDFTCVATAQRSLQRAKQNDFKLIDTIRYEVAHSGGKELWSWPGAPRFQDTPLTQMIQNGAISVGDFASHARSVFSDNVATVKYFGPEELDGRQTLRWDYKIPLLVSGWRIAYASQSELVAARGSFWIDPDTLDVARLQVEADGISPEFPVTTVVTTIDYARTRIGQMDVLLPQSAVLLEQISGERTKNITEFSHCRQYSGQSAISFDVRSDVGPTPAGKKIEEVALAPGLTAHIKLISAIGSDGVIGDPLQATVASDIVHRGEILVPKGAAITGRIRRIEKHDEGPYFIIGIEFDDIDFPGHHARFFASLKNLEQDTRDLQFFMDLGGMKFETSEGITKITVERSLHLGEVAGVGTFFMKGSRFRIPEGTIMVWETVAEASAPK